MSIASTTVWSYDAGGGASLTGGGGFNPGNANFIADWAATSATGNSPVITSATYTFVAGDVGALFYVKSGTNWTPGMYPIVSVTGGAATLGAAIGGASQLSASTGQWTPNTVAGCATTGSPTSGTCGINYAPLTAAFLSLTDLACTGSGSTNVTSAAALFGPQMVGNILRINNQGTGSFGILGWFELASYTNATTMVTDRTIANSASPVVNAQGKVGGAFYCGGTADDLFFEGATASTDGFGPGNFVFFRGVVSGAQQTYTLGGTFSIASTRCTAAAVGRVIGFKSVWGDDPSGNDRPIIAVGANIFLAAQYVNYSSVIFTTSATNGINFVVGSVLSSCKFYNSSSTSARNATTSANSVVYFNCEFVSLNGVGAGNGPSAAVKFVSCYFHDSDTGANSTAARGVYIDSCLFEGMKTVGFVNTNTTGIEMVKYSTFYGSEAKVGIGINWNANPNPSNVVLGCIFYGLATGINVATAQQDSNLLDYNDFYNNTADVALCLKGPHDFATNPSFAGATQITDTTATTSGSTLTQSGGDFSTVQDNVDVLHVVSGTGVTVAQYLITGHTGTTLTTNNALGTSSGGDVVYFVTTGHNFAPTA